VDISGARAFLSQASWKPGRGRGRNRRLRDPRKPLAATCPFLGVPFMGALKLFLSVEAQFTYLKNREMRGLDSSRL
jgi:hypothetical protein